MSVDKIGSALVGVFIAALALPIPAALAAQEVEAQSFPSVVDALERENACEINGLDTVSSYSRVLTLATAELFTCSDSDDNGSKSYWKISYLSPEYGIMSEIDEAEYEGHKPGRVDPPPTVKIFELPAL